jgi:hypothetical protein
MTNLSKRTLCGAIMTRAAAVVAVVLGLTSPAFGQGRTLEGVWAVATQDRNCTTNAPQGSPTRALITYQADGTVSESRHIPVFATGQLSESHGIWNDDGRGNYQGRVVTMINFETAAGTPPGSPGFLAGWMLASQTITLTGPHSFTMTGSTQMFNLDLGVYRVGCASRTGERLR